MERAAVTIRPPHDGEDDPIDRIGEASTAFLASYGFPQLLDDGHDSPTIPPGSECWVACLDDGSLAGYACGRELRETYWLTELSVHPDWMRKGIGTALLEAVVDRARTKNCAAIGLSTFRDVPFNMPFYARRGFDEINPDALELALRRQFEAEIPPGVAPGDRVAMLKRL